MQNHEKYKILSSRFYNAIAFTSLVFAVRHLTIFMQPRSLDLTSQYHCRSDCSIFLCRCSAKTKSILNLKFIIIQDHFTVEPTTITV